MRLLLAQARASANGGAELYCEELVRVLREAGHDIGTIDVNGHTAPTGETCTLPHARQGRILWNWAEVCHALPDFIGQYDRLILGFGEGPDLQIPTVTVRHAPAVFSEHPALLNCIGAKASPLRRAYVRLCRARARLTWQDRSDWTLANTEWTARLAREHDGASVDGILYPPLGDPAPRGHTKRLAHRMLCLGRVARNKRIEDAVRVLDLLKATGIPAELEICGYVTDSYGRKLARMLERRDNVVLTLNATPAQKARALAEASIGLHMFRGEHFGIAVAEMIDAGVAPIVFDDGGVRELVDTSELRFTTLENAAQIALHLMTRPDLRDAFVTQLASGPALWRARNFDEEALRALRFFLTEPGHASVA